jgi:serum/glucocorticoid-regulated kinase 2
MDWLRSKKSSVTNLKAEAASLARSTTPTPRNPDGKPDVRSGLLTIRVLWAEGLSLPEDLPMPPAIHSALATQQAKVAASVSPSSVTQQRLAHRSRGNRYPHTYQPRACPLT